MKGIVIAVIVIYVLCAFMGCFDRKHAVENAHDGREGKPNEIVLEDRHCVCGVRRGVHTDRDMATAVFLTAAGSTRIASDKDR